MSNEINTQESVAKITKDMIVGDVVSKYPDTVPTFIRSGMFCIACPASQMETIEEASAVHGIPVDDLVEALNETVNSLD